ncbi:MFS transporter [Streptomyces sp. NPDC102406]|uniref:MFS transporter n=1 Tax=Streptomyces sp. NPDC102406 TaxID=3366171 RepID=UPI003810470E
MVTTAQPTRRVSSVKAPQADVPPGRRVRDRPVVRRLLRPVPASVCLGLVLHVAWLLFFANSGGDLAAQDAWADFARRHPGSAYNLTWYGGVHPVSYSFVSPYVMAVLGVRTTMIVIGVVSSGLLAHIVSRCGGVRRPLLPSLWGAVALVCNAASGRVTFGLGLMFALAVTALVFSCPPRLLGTKWRHVWVVVCSVLATASSPVAGLFLEVVAAALLLQGRRRIAYAIALPFPLVLAVSAWLFPFQGVQPMPWISGLLPVGCCALVYVLSPPQWRTVRLGSIVYALGTVATMAFPSQVGLNVERLALIFGGTVLLASVEYNRTRAHVRVRYLSVVWLAFAALACWQLGKPAADLVLTTPDEAWSKDLKPLVHQLETRDAGRGRVEVVPVRSHREAAALVPYVNLARGWNRQADLDRNKLFYDGSLDAHTYRAWLKQWAVRYVVLPVGDRPDTGAAQEARLVAAGQPYLKKIWSDPHWRLYRVAGATPLVDPPATAVREDEGQLEVRMKSAGDVLVRVRYSPWLGLVDARGEPVERPEVVADAHRPSRAPAGQDRSGPKPVKERSEEGVAYLNRYGCVTQAGTWVRLHAPHPGTYRLAAPLQIPRGTPCPD